MKRRKLLWISDACIPTGFARVTHNLLGWLGGQWDRAVLGINWLGDPHPYPYPVYPAVIGGDMWGFSRFVELVRKENPDVVLVQSDAWLVEGFVEIKEQVKEWGRAGECPPLVGYMPVDGKGMKRSTAAKLSGLDLALFYTEFGEEQALDAGFRGKSGVVGLGVRKELYHPPSEEVRQAVRAKLIPGIDPSTFIIGNVNRNQPRKRLDLTIACFAEFLRRGGDGVLYIHCLEEDIGWDLVEVAHYYGVTDRLYMPKAKSYTELWPESALAAAYAAFDLQITTTVGEGWGLPTLEGMACGIPQIVPEWAALGEWARGGVRYVPVIPGEANFGHKCFGIGAVPDRDAFVDAMLELYQDATKRQELARKGREHALEPRFEWANSARKLHDYLLGAVDRREVAAA